MKRRILSLLLAICLVAGLLPTVALAAEPTDASYFKFDKTTGTITGLTDDTLTEIVIPDTIDNVKVTAIGEEAFKGLQELTSITIPSSVKSIEHSAFEGCKNLKSVTFGEDSKLESIGNRVFYNCQSLTSIDIPNSVESIGESAFQYCKNITSITIPSGVKSIKLQAFYQCTGLTSITIHNGVTSIGASAFYQCSSLTSIDIPNSVTSIGNEVFYGCTSLTIIFLPDKDNLSISEYTPIPDTTSQVKYSLDETAGEVTITEIALGTNKTGVDIPATICGYPVVAISDENLLTKISSHTCAGGTATCRTKATCGICKQEYGELAGHTFIGRTCTVCGYTKPASTYAITVESTENGDVTSSRKTASKGTTVTLTVEPDKGYTLETLTVTDKNGSEIELTNKGDGKYTFKMPASKVTVEATFIEDNSMLNFFVDVFPGDYYYDAVLWAAENGITGGVDDTHFAPNAPCTRAQIVTFLWRAAGCPEPENLSSFTDVSADSYYAKAVAWAVENGITTGTGSGAFSPDATCTRAQAMTFIYRSVQAQGGGMQGAWMFQNPFEDVDLESYYGEAVMWAVANGVTSGTTATTFSPNNDCTRAQIVTFLYRCLGGE